ncbi:MAG: hypothetical protein MPJ50_08110, partial [Pirellulales bacterium]|nr:hypothetical protein [Pirellulales bacterium]
MIPGRDSSVELCGDDTVQAHPAAVARRQVIQRVQQFATGHTATAKIALGAGAGCRFCESPSAQFLTEICEQ